MGYASTGYANGSDFGVYVDGTLIAVGLDNQISLTRNMINVSNKDTPDDEEYIPGRGDGTVNGSARFKYDAGYGWPDLVSIYNNKTLVTIRYSNNTTGDDEETFSAYLVSLSKQDPDDDNSQIDYEFQKTGALTVNNIV